MEEKGGGEREGGGKETYQDVHVLTELFITMRLNDFSEGAAGVNCWGHGGGMFVMFL